MSWARGFDSQGREIGYAIRAFCDHRSCNVRIDRGLPFTCGGMVDGGEYGCGNFYCDLHRSTTVTGPATVSLCRDCMKRYEAKYPSEEM